MREAEKVPQASPPPQDGPRLLEIIANGSPDKVYYRLRPTKHKFLGEVLRS